MRVRKLIRALRCGISCSDREWDVRSKLVKMLNDSGFSVETCPNPCRINAYKDGERYDADIITWSGGKLEVHPFGAVEYRYGALPKEGAPIIDIPYQGRYGVYVKGKNSKLFEQLCKRAKKSLEVK